MPNPTRRRRGDKSQCVTDVKDTTTSLHSQPSALDGFFDSFTLLMEIFTFFFSTKKRHEAGRIKQFTKDVMAHQKPTVPDKSD